MKKQSILKLIKEVAVQEMARIATLYQLTSTNPSEIDAKLPPELKKSGMVKNIIDDFIENNNTPESTIGLAKKFGYSSQQAVNGFIQRLKLAGILQDKGLAKPKIGKPEPQSHIRGRIGTPIDAKSDYDKIKFILGKLRTGEPKEEYKTWFITKYSEPDYNNLKQLMNQYNVAKTKEELQKVKANIKATLAKLGISTPKQGRKPGLGGDEDDAAAYVNTEIPDDGYDYDDDSTSLGENQPQRKLAPERPSRALPGIAEPPTRTAPTPDRKRRTLTPPDPDARPKPKNEDVPSIKYKSPQDQSKGDIGGYGWDAKRGLTQKPKPPITQTNKPKVKEVSNTFNKIVKRYTDLKK